MSALEGTDRAGSPGRLAASAADARRAVLLFAVLVLAYCVNGDFLVGHDSTPNVLLPSVLLASGELTFTPENAPFAFERKRGADGRAQAVPRYFLVETRQPGHFVAAYGPAPGLLALPVVAALSAVAGDLREQPALLWHAAKLVAALLTALGAVFVFLAARSWLQPGGAAGLALLYGLATSAFATGSQALWQQTPVLTSLAAALWLLQSAARSREFAGGLALGFAALCRPQSLLFVVAVGLGLAWRQRRLPVAFGLGAGSMLALLALWNAHHFGDPLALGQADIGARIALRTTGSADLWQTPLLEGLVGLLLSPSRGLLVYTPLFAFSFVGAWLAFRDERWSPLRAWSLASLALIAMSARYFNWWGGWSFGYRYLLDLVPVLVLLLIPVLARYGRSRAFRAAFAALLVWSLAVQLVGALLYDVAGWNAGLVARAPDGTTRPLHDATRVPELQSRGFQIELRDVDLPEHRARLWSLRDSQLLEYLAHPAEARRAKRAGMAQWLEQAAPREGELIE